MTKYSIFVSHSAEIDLSEAVSYITDNLQAQKAAKRIFTSIRDGLRSLSVMPERYPLIDLEPFRSQGVRKLLIENYIVFYMVDMEAKDVHILRILYNRRQWESLL